MNILLITDTNLNNERPWVLARGAVDFGHLYVVAALREEHDSKAGVFSLLEPTLPSKRLRYPRADFYHVAGATMSECTELALTTSNWLPAIDIVLIDDAHDTCPCPNLRQCAMHAIVVAQSHGVSALSFSQVKGTPQQQDILSYATERLLRVISTLSKHPPLALSITVPNLRPNECEGFAVVKADKLPWAIRQLNRHSTPWTFDLVTNEYTDPLPGTEEWAIQSKRIAVRPFWRSISNSADEQFDALVDLITAITRLGSSRAYGAAIERRLEHNVKYRYHFKGAVLSGENTYCAEHSAAPFADVIDSHVEMPLLEYAFGRVLDVGCGSGRIALYLITQRSNYVKEVVGIDSNPVSLRDYEQRWSQAVQVPCTTHCIDIKVEDLSSLGSFDSILLFGDTLGIGGNFDGVAKLLVALRGLISPHGRLIVTGRDPLKTSNKDEQLINTDNLAHGFHPGERFIRITFEGHDTGWFEFCYLSLEELRELSARTGWELLDEYVLRQEPDRYGVILQPDYADG